MSSQFQSSSQTDNVLLPNVIDDIAESEPSLVWIEYPALSTSYDSGFKQITFKQLANAIDGTAAWLESGLGRGKDHETLTYIGPNDPFYGILVVAAVKAGYKVRPSPEWIVRGDEQDMLTRSPDAAAITEKYSSGCHESFGQLSMWHCTSQKSIKPSSTSYACHRKVAQPRCP